jgi:predicted GTPase
MDEDRPRPVVIVVTKSDLWSSDTSLLQVDIDEIHEYCQIWHIPYITCSAKTGHNVDRVFAMAARYHLLHQINRYAPPPSKCAIQ